MMNRRSFLTAAAASIFVPQFGRFFREGSGTLWVRNPAFYGYIRTAPTFSLVDMYGVPFQRRSFLTGQVR